MHTINQIFSLSNRVLAVVEHPMLKRARLGFTLQQPFAWSLINTAAVAARLLDEHNLSAQCLESESVRDAVMDSELDLERMDQLIIKMATLRHFNRMACGSNDIGMGTINACLKPEELDVDLEAIKQSARDRIKIERRMGKLKAQDVAARFNTIVTGTYQAECDRKRQMKRLMDEVFFLCNRSDDMLFVGHYEKQLEAHTVLRDAELADFDQFDYLGEALAEKCVEPVIRAKSEIQALMDRSYRSNVLADGSQLLAEINKLAVELGINFAKIDAQNAAIDAELAAAEHATAADEAAIDDLDVDLGAIAELDANEALINDRKRTTVKSEARLKREAEEAQAAAQRAEYAAANAAKAAKAKATRAAKSLASQA